MSLSSTPAKQERSVFPAPGYPGQVIVEMTPGEVAEIYQNATDRIKLSRLDPSRPQRYDPGWTKALELELDGVMAEKAIAKLLRSYYQGAIVIGKRLPVDDGGHEAKGTSYAKGHLLIQKDTRDDVPGVLGIREGTYCRIVGWLMVKDCKQPKWWNTKLMHKPCYAVPQGALREVRTLLEWKRENVVSGFDRLIDLLTPPNKHGWF